MLNYVLLIEDDPGHARLIHKNLIKSGFEGITINVEDGIKAVEYLKDNVLTPPFIIFLDLNLPGLDGFQILKYIRSTIELKNLPVIMLTTTDNPKEVAKCYEYGCNLYVTKPVEYTDFSNTVQNLGRLLSILKTPYTHHHEDR